MKIFDKKKLAQIALIPLLAIILSVLFFYPALPQINDMFIGDGGDNYEYASYMMLFRKNVLEGRAPFESINFLRYPVGFDFAISFDSHLAVTLGGIMHILLKFPLGYNLTVFILTSLNSILSYIFFRYLTRSNLLGTLGMIIYGFSFYTLAKAEAHLNLLFIGGFPLLFYSILKILRENEIGFKNAILFFFSLLLIALGSKQYFVLSVFALIVFSIVGFIFYKDYALITLKKIRSSFIQIAVASFIFIAAMAGIFHPYISLLLNNNLNMINRADTLFKSTPPLVDFFLPNPYLNLVPNLLSSPSPKSIEYAVFIGWIELILFILFLTRKSISKRLRMFILSLFAIPFLLALGYGEQNQFPLLPYRFIKDFFVFRAIAEPGRFFVIFYLVVTSGILLFLSSLKQLRRFGVIVFFATILITLERIPMTIMTVPTLEDDYAQVVRASETAAVLDIPVNQYHPDYNVLPFYYNKPIVNGYFHWLADNEEKKSFLNSPDLNLLRDYSCTDQEPTPGIDYDKFLNNLKKQGINIIVVHKDTNIYSSDCRNVRINLNNLSKNIFVPEETNDQKEIVTTITNSQPDLEVYFPKDGEFYLNGLYIAPDSEAEFAILLNGAPIDAPHSWNPVGSPNAMEILPRNEIILDVTKGSKLSIKSNSLVNNTYISIWYRYNPNSPEAVPLIKPVDVIYTSDMADVFKIN